ncbi:MAG TPA: hypothetical protein VGJ86_23975 [Acidimicrobiales bacterium]
MSIADHAADAPALLDHLLLIQRNRIHPGGAMPPYPVTWVTIDGVASGEWGIAGKPLHTGDVVGMRSAAQ